MRKIFLFLCVAVLVGCSQKIAEFTYLSTKQIDLGRGFSKSLGKVDGVDEASIIIIFPTGQIRMDDAVNDVFNSNPNACVLSNVEVYSKFWFIPYIYGHGEVVVEGTALGQ